MAFRGTVGEGEGFPDAFREAGLPPEAADELARLLASQVDLLSDVRPGDSFQLLYRGAWEEERLLGDPVLLMVSVVNLDRKLEFFRRTGRSSGFYDAEFRSVAKPLMASPLQYGLVAPAFPDTGRYGIVKEELPGRVLYGAPPGATVSAVAPGTVRYAGRRGALGNLVVVSHGENGYETLYSHLSGFAEGVSPGAEVKGGQPLGRVGMSGATLSPV
jgi:murein DD-endopeptidase MepM/ murein hydrolase activator NlpD